MDRINEVVVTAFTALGAMGAFIVKKLYKRIEKVENKLDSMELLTRDDIKQITDTQNLILKHLLEHRATEQNNVHK